MTPSEFLHYFLGYFEALEATTTGSYIERAKLEKLIAAARSAAGRPTAKPVGPPIDFERTVEYVPPVPDDDDMPQLAPDQPQF